MDTPMNYEIRIRGELDAGWSDWFAGLTCTNLPGGETLVAGHPYWPFCRSRSARSRSRFWSFEAMSARLS